MQIKIDIVSCSLAHIVSYRIDSCNCFYPTWLCKFNLFITPIPISLSITHIAYTRPSSDNSLSTKIINLEYHVLESFRKFWQRFHIGMLISYFIATHFSFLVILCVFLLNLMKIIHIRVRVVSWMKCVWKYASWCLLILWMKRWVMRVIHGKSEWMTLVKRWIFIKYYIDFNLLTWL